MSRTVQPPSSPPRPRRGPVRRYLEARGLVGRHAGRVARVRLVTADGTPLRGSYLPGPSDAAVAVLLAHGFAANRRKPAYARLADGLARTAPVLSLDLRGHGRSGGRSTLGDREADDVLAGFRWLQAFGHRRVVLLGVSMGATAVLHAASRGAEVAAVVTVSGPAWFHASARTPPMQRLERLWHSPAQRRLLQLLLGIRLAGPDAWRDPPHPVEMAAALTVPLLVLHGRDDAYFPIEDAQSLVTAAADGVLWDEPDGFGHAEDGLDDRVIDRLTLAVATVGTRGRFPPRDS